MASILSQQEIDSLLSGAGPAEPQQVEVAQKETDAQKPEIAAFDFRLPHRISNTQMRILQTLHESFGESFASYLVSRLQTTVTVHVGSVSQLFYSEYVYSVPSPSCLYVFRVVESNTLAMMEFSPELMMAMVAMMLGGSTAGELKQRALTKIEQNLARGIQQRAISDLQTAWRMITPLTFENERYETEGEFAQIAPSTEIVLVVGFEVTFNDKRHPLNICFPTFALDRVLASLNKQQLSVAPQKDASASWSEEILGKLSATTVPARAVLGTTSLTLSELLYLEPGDIIRTNIAVSEDVQVVIGEKTRVGGRVGFADGRYAVKLTHIDAKKE